MSDMVERLRVVLRTYSDEHASKTDHESNRNYWPYWDAMARAAIEAMREPTQEMISAVYDNADPGFCDERGEPTPPDEAWKQMIDRALGKVDA